MGRGRKNLRTKEKSDKEVEKKGQTNKINNYRVKSNSKYLNVIMININKTEVCIQEDRTYFYITGL